MISMLALAAVSCHSTPLSHPMVRAFERVRARASTVRAEELGAADPHTASPLPLLERIRRECDDCAEHGRHHPQLYDEGPGAHRRTQTSAAATEVSKTLTAENTEPLRIAVDFSAMFPPGSPDTATLSAAAHRPAPSTSLPGSTCFHVGHWFKWNFPKSLSPPCAQAKQWQEHPTWAKWVKTSQDSCDDDVTGNDSPNVYSPSNREAQMCNRKYDSTAQNCWGVCLEEDVLRTSNDEGCDPSQNTDKTVCNMREWLMDKVIKSVRETERFYRVKRLQGNLMLVKSEGVYQPIYKKYGLSGAECAKDGVSAHTVFFPFMSQYMPQVAGFGGAAGADQHGRPTILLMGISVPMTASARSRYDYRSIILHELLHGLGFGITNFRNSFSHDGSKKQIVKLQKMTDVDGSTDEVWTVVSPRTLAVARKYFGCASLASLPLMGENQLGAASRGSHWETRIMNDEFMAYGRGTALSAITLALMEDMGNYMANYSLAQCMTWGARQGCSFVHSRCGKRRDDLSIQQSGTLNGSKRGSCNRHYQRSYGGNHYMSDPLLVAKCGAVDCSSCPAEGSAAHRSLDNTAAKACADCLKGATSNRNHSHPQCWRNWSIVGKCNAECLDPELATAAELAQLECGEVQSAGLGAIEAAGAPSLQAAQDNGFLANELVRYCILAVSLAAMVAAIAGHHLTRENYDHIHDLAVFVNLVTILVGVAVFTFALWLLYGDVNIKAITGSNAVQYLIALAAVVIVWGVFGLVAIREARIGDTIPMAIFVGVLTAVILFQSLAFFAACVWMKDSYSIEAKQFSALGHQASSSQSEQQQALSRTDIDAIDHFLDESMRRFEATTCNTYRRCCFTVGSVASSGQSVQWMKNSSSSHGQNDHVTEKVSSCVQAHGGSSVGRATTVLSDPSSADFCRLLSGSTYKRGQGQSTELLCSGFETAGILKLDLATGARSCKAEFCSSGIQGYEDFVSNSFNWLRANLKWVILLLLVFGFGEFGLLLTSFAIMMIGKVEKRKENAREKVRIRRAQAERWNFLTEGNRTPTTTYRSGKEGSDWQHPSVQGEEARAAWLEQLFAGTTTEDVGVERSARRERAASAGLFTMRSSKLKAKKEDVVTLNPMLMVGQDEDENEDSGEEKEGEGGGGGGVDDDDDI